MAQVPEEYLVRKERDILEKEGIYVFTPSPFARENLFYILLGALYTCGPRYEVRRTGPDSFLLFYIKSGEILFEYEKKAVIARPGDVVFLDCRRPHHYKAMTQAQFYWFHFDGNASPAYFHHFMNNKGIHFPDRRKMEENFILIHDMLRGGAPDEGILSVHLHRILALLFSSAGRARIPSDGVSRAMTLIDNHYMDSLSMHEIAAAAGFSESHLYRVFREEAGVTPHEYLMNVRLNQAMQMLLNTSRPVEEIAERCAFCSSSIFIRSFRQSTGVTPLKFRKLILGVTSSL